MLICENILFSVDGHKLISGINLNIQSQKDLLITGPSGIGKTSFLSILCGLQKPTQGNVIYNDINLYDMSENKIDDSRPLEVSPGRILGCRIQSWGQNRGNPATMGENLGFVLTNVFV